MWVEIFSQRNTCSLILIFFSFQGAIVGTEKHGTIKKMTFLNTPFSLHKHFSLLVLKLLCHIKALKSQKWVFTSLGISSLNLINPQWVSYSAGLQFFLTFWLLQLQAFSHQVSSFLLVCVVVSLNIYFTSPFNKLERFLSPEKEEKYFHYVFEFQLFKQ